MTENQGVPDASPQLSADGQWWWTGSEWVPGSTRPPSGPPADSRVDALLASARSPSATTAVPVPPGEGMPWPASWNLIAPPVAWASCGPADHALTRAPSVLYDASLEQWTCERCGEIRQAPPNPNAVGMRGYCFICDGRMWTFADAPKHYRQLHHINVCEICTTRVEGTRCERHTPRSEEAWERHSTAPVAGGRAAMRCPTCSAGAEYIETQSRGKKAAKVAAFGVLAIGSVSKTFKCNRCGFCW